MTNDEIMRCEIPEGKYRLVLENMGQELMDADGIESNPYLESVNAAFEALLGLARGMDLKTVLGYEAGYDAATSDVLAVVGDIADTDDVAISDYDKGWDAALETCKRRILAHEGEK
jgi:hypothetical protein